MDHEIPYHLWALKHQAAVQTDRAPGRAAAPAAALPADQHALEIKTQLAGALMQRRAEDFGSSFSEPTAKYLPYGATITRVTIQRE